LHEEEEECKKAMDERMKETKTMYQVSGSLTSHTSVRPRRKKKRKERKRKCNEVNEER